VQTLSAQRLQDVLADGLAGFGAQPPHIAGRIVARQRSQVNAGHGAQQPRRLPVLLDGAPSAERRCPAFNSAAIDARLVHPSQIERHPGVAAQRARNFDGFCGFCFSDDHKTRRRGHRVSSR
jgi:hypothetical protein